MGKKQIKEVIKGLDRWSIDGDTLETIAAHIKQWQEEYGKGVTIDIDNEESWGETRLTVKFYKMRPETDEELATRLVQEEDQGIAQQEYKRKQYEQLKKEFGE